MGYSIISASVETQCKRRLAIVKGPSVTQYRVYLAQGAMPDEVATIAMTAHGCAWRWAKDLTKGNAAEVLAFVQSVADSTNFAGEASDWKAEYSKEEGTAGREKCRLENVKTGRVVWGWHSSKHEATVRALFRAGMTSAMAAENAHKVRGYVGDAQAQKEEAATAPVAERIPARVADILCKHPGAVVTVKCQGAEPGTWTFNEPFPGPIMFDASAAVPIPCPHDAANSDKPVIAVEVPDRRATIMANAGAVIEALEIAGQVMHAHDSMFSQFNEKISREDRRTRHENSVRLSELLQLLGFEGE